MSAIDTLNVLSAKHKNTAVNWEHILCEQYTAALDKPKVIVDIGAHKGSHTEQFVAIGAQRVQCFEPIPFLARDLRQKFMDKPVTINEVALSNTAGSAEFTVNTAALAESGLKEKIYSVESTGKLEKIKVKIETLDSYGFRDVSFVKLDCEGAEINALEGGVETIRRDRPLISTEYGWISYEPFGRKARDLFDFAASVGYEALDLFGNSLADAAIYDAAINVYWWDYFIAPLDRPEFRQRLQTNGERIKAALLRSEKYLYAAP